MIYIYAYNESIIMVHPSKKNKREHAQPPLQVYISTRGTVIYQAFLPEKSTLSLFSGHPCMHTYSIRLL